MPISTLIVGALATMTDARTKIAVAAMYTSYFILELALNHLQQ